MHSSRSVRRTYRWSCTIYITYSQYYKMSRMQRKPSHNQPISINLSFGTQICRPALCKIIAWYPSSSWKDEQRYWFHIIVGSWESTYGCYTSLHQTSPDHLRYSGRRMIYLSNEGESIDRWVGILVITPRLATWQDRVMMVLRIDCE